MFSILEIISLYLLAKKSALTETGQGGALGGAPAAATKTFILYYILYGACLVLPFVLIFNPEFAVAIYYGLQILAATLVSRFCSST